VGERGGVATVGAVPLLVRLDPGRGGEHVGARVVHGQQLVPLVVGQLDGGEVGGDARVGVVHDRGDVGPVENLDREPVAGGVASDIEGAVGVVDRGEVLAGDGVQRGDQTGADAGSGRAGAALVLDGRGGHTLA